MLMLVRRWQRPSRGGGRGGARADADGHIALSSGAHGCYHGGPTRTVCAKATCTAGNRQTGEHASRHARKQDKHTHPQTHRHTQPDCCCGFARFPAAAPGHCVQRCIMPSCPRARHRRRCHRNIRARRWTTGPVPALHRARGRGERTAVRVRTGRGSSTSAYLYIGTHARLASLCGVAWQGRFVEALPGLAHTHRHTRRRRRLTWMLLWPSRSAPRGRLCAAIRPGGCQCWPP